MSKEEKPVREVPTEEQNNAAYSGPAPAVNRFVATLGPLGLRLAFLEEDIQKGYHFRGACLMHPQDAIKLYKLLQDLLKDMEAQIAKLEAEQAAKEAGDG